MHNSRQKLIDTVGTYIKYYHNNNTMFKKRHVHTIHIV